MTNLNVNSPDVADVPVPRDRRRLFVAVGIAVLALVAATIGTVLYVQRPIPSSFEATIKTSTVTLGQSVVVEGILRPAAPLRTVTLQVQRQNGAWTDAGVTARPDAAGRFTLTTSPTAAGSLTYRLSTGKVERVKAGTSARLKVAVLTPSTIGAQTAESVKLGATVKINGVVTPAASDRTVIMESSTNGSTWVPAGAQTTTAEGGTYVLELPATVAGSMKYRSHVQADATHAEAASPAVTVTVEDYAAAGQHYLAAVEPANEVGHKYNQVLQKPNATLAELTASAREYAAAERTMTDSLAAYLAWPKDVKPLIDELVAGATTEYGLDNQLAASGSLAEFSDKMNGVPNLSYSGDVAEQIRQKLGLPARSGD